MLDNDATKLRPSEQRLTEEHCGTIWDTFGSLLFMALIGLVLASIVNIFWANSTLYWIITYAGVLIFVGLTAYDTQKLKMIGIQTADNPALAHSVANRFPSLDPLHVLQIEMLRRYRAGDTDDLVARALELTINAIATGLRNSG